MVVVGMTGVGKTTIGARLAHHLERSFVDLDRYIVAKTGRSIAEIFRDKGESGFRKLENRALRECLARGPDLVISTGGGAVVSAQNRQLMRRGVGTSETEPGPLVIWLQASIEELVGRVSHNSDRPLLAGDPQGVLTELLSQRNSWYEEVAELSICTEKASVMTVVSDLVETITSKRPAPPQPDCRAVMLGSAESSSSRDAGSGVVSPSVKRPAEKAIDPVIMEEALIVEEVRLGQGRSYPVVVGNGARHKLASLIPPDVGKVAIVTQPGIDVAVDPGMDHQVFMVEPGERAKRLSVVEDLARSFARWGMTRKDLVVAVGGGVVTDLGGFVAASYHRGIRVIHVSTTLLGQIDASIGGKCGVNLEEGKNLVGAFWQPTAVICDTETLASLPGEEFRSGLGELAKYHFIGGTNLAELELPDRVAACVRIKADVVGEDEREGGRRAILNYGHTLGHALETISARHSDGHYQIRHGEGVAIGLVYAAEVARALGRISEERVAEHRAVVGGYDLACTVPEGLDPLEIIELFGRDKKAATGITLVLDGDSGLESVPVADVELLLACLDRMNG